MLSVRAKIYDVQTVTDRITHKQTDARSHGRSVAVSLPSSQPPALSSHQLLFFARRQRFPSNTFTSNTSKNKTVFLSAEK